MVEGARRKVRPSGQVLHADVPKMSGRTEIRTTLGRDSSDLQQVTQSPCLRPDHVGMDGHHTGHAASYRRSTGRCGLSAGPGQLTPETPIMPVIAKPLANCHLQSTKSLV